MRWHELLDTREHLWCHQCVTAWKRFIYVVPSLIQLSKGKKIYKDEILAARSNVARLSVKMLKQTLRDERIQVNPGMLLEKNDFVEAIVEGRKQKILLYNEPKDILYHSPLSLLLPRETYAKCALRLSLQDHVRTALTEDELTSFEWCIRTRSDGPLERVNSEDPWYSGQGTGKCIFDAKDKSLTFTWPTVDGVEMNPFASMGMSMQNPMTLHWEFEYGGRVVRLIFPNGGGGGPQEVKVFFFFFFIFYFFFSSIHDYKCIPCTRYTPVPTIHFYCIKTPLFLFMVTCFMVFLLTQHTSSPLLNFFTLYMTCMQVVSRHPVHGGWILYSQGSVWTSYPMPCRGKDGQCVDEYLKDQNLCKLPSDLQKSY
jgi:hypothetical protein